MDMHGVLQDLVCTTFLPDAGKEELEHAFQICQHMLMDRSLPLDVRAGCYLVLNRGNDKPIECAEQAISMYRKLYIDNMNNSLLRSQFVELIRRAMDELEKAKQRANTKVTNSKNQAKGVAAREGLEWILRRTLVWDKGSSMRIWSSIVRAAGI